MEPIAVMFVIGVLLVIGSSWLAPKIGVAAPILLVVVGIGCSFIPGLAPLNIEPEWILTIVLPPSLYAAAVSVPITDFRRNFLAISRLSPPRSPSRSHSSRFCRPNHCTHPECSPWSSLACTPGSRRLGI